MKTKRSVACFLSAGFAGWLSLCATAAQTEPPLPSAAEIVTKAFERAKQIAAQGARKKYAYTRHQVTEELDSKGAIKERREKKYEVLLIAGWPYSKLVRINGEPLSEKQAVQEEERERKARERFSRRKQSRGGELMALSQDLIDRYAFTVERREVLNGRPALVLSFQPRSKDLPIKQMADHVLNHVAGHVWVDEVEFDIAKFDLHLERKLTLWDGILASFERFDLMLVRTRMEQGVWINSSFASSVEGRKLFDSVRYKTREQSSNFRRMTDEGSMPQ